MGPVDLWLTEFSVTHRVLAYITFGFSNNALQYLIPLLFFVQYSLYQTSNTITGMKSSNITYKSMVLKKNMKVTH
jgi:hypothetical protein